MRLWPTEFHHSERGAGSIEAFLSGSSVLSLSQLASLQPSSTSHRHTLQAILRLCVGVKLSCEHCLGFDSGVS